MKVILLLKCLLFLKISTLHRTITAEEWEVFTKVNIERAAKEINGARPLRAYVDTLLKQVFFFF